MDVLFTFNLSLTCHSLQSKKALAVVFIMRPPPGKTRASLPFKLTVARRSNLLCAPCVSAGTKFSKNLQITGSLTKRISLSHCTFPNTQDSFVITG